MKHRVDASPISAVDLFCGAGGLTHGLVRAGVRVEAGIDVDPAAEHAYTKNNPGARFLAWDVAKKKYPSIGKLFATDKYKLLAGCAPCQPFSKLTNGIERHRSWDLLGNFGRFVAGIEPELVTMENVPELAQRGSVVFESFLRTLERNRYAVDWKIVSCADYAPQSPRQRREARAATQSRLFAGSSRRRSTRRMRGTWPHRTRRPSVLRPAQRSSRRRQAPRWPRCRRRPARATEP